jgi:hypothetical protein
MDPRVQKAARSARWVKALMAAAFLCGAIFVFLKPIVEQNQADSGRNTPGIPTMNIEGVPAVGSPVSFVDGVFVFARKGNVPMGEAGPWMKGKITWVGTHNGEPWVKVDLDEDFNGKHAVWAVGESVVGE